MWIEKEDLINQSSIQSFILFIINTFHSVVALSPARAPDPRVMDWSRIRSHSSLIQSFILFTFHSLSPHRAPHPRVMDWSWFRSHSSFIHHSYYQILSIDNYWMHHNPIEWIWEKEDSSIQITHNDGMNLFQCWFHSIDHSSLSYICFRTYWNNRVWNFLFQWVWNFLFQ